MSDKNIDKDIELLREMQLNGVKAILNGGMYKDEKAELKVNAIENVLSELEIKDNMIDLMAEHIEDWSLIDEICFKLDCCADKYTDGHCEKCLKCIKEHFRNEVLKDV